MRFPWFPADSLIVRIVGAFEGPRARAYCLIRFIILRGRFLAEIERYLPRSGTVLDIGSGFGLFALYFAARSPGIEVQGFELNAQRVAAARRAAAKLGLTNVRFEVADVAAIGGQRQVAAAYMLDLIHHVPRSSVDGLLRSLAHLIEPGGCLVIKDIEPTPAYKLAFTWLLDKLVDYRAPVHYWVPAEVQAMLESSGFRVRQSRLPDYLPYPHVLYVGVRE